MCLTFATPSPAFFFTRKVLQPPHGVALVASKTFYFGVGGGTKSFRRLVKKDGIFEVKTLATIEEPGSGNKREVRGEGGGPRGSRGRRE